MSPGQLVLPFRGDQFSFGLNYKSSPEDVVAADLSAVLFNRQGEFLDVVHTHKPTAMMGAVCSSRDPSLWPEGCQPVAGDDVIHVLPKKLDPAAEIILLVASAPDHPCKARDLASAPRLEFTMTWANEADHSALTQSETHNLGDVLSAAAASGATPQSIIVAACYLDQPGWTLRMDLTVSPHTGWATMVPDLQAAIMRVKEQAGVDLDAARALAAKAEAAGGQLDQTAIMGFSRQWEDRELNAAASIRLPEAAAVGKVRLDIGWTLWKKNEDELEGTSFEFALKFYNAAGEEVQAVGTNEREAQGVTVGRPEPEEGEEEEEAEPEPEPEEEAEEGEGGEEGEEEGEEKAPPPPPPEPAEDPYAFKLRDVVFIELKELPKDVRCAVLVVANYGGSGFEHLKSATVKMLDVTGGEEKARPLADYTHYSKFTQDAALTQVALLKLYKEYTDSAWNLWRASGAKSVAEFVASDPEAIKKALKEKQAAHKQFKAEEAKAIAAAEESGEELAQELRISVWRYGVLGLAMGGDSLEAAEHDIKDNVVNYDGPLKSNEARTFDCARVQFANGDTYFGGYQDDLKSGPGIYCFATGALYVGEYKAGKRAGRGIFLLPDGGQYEGELSGDRFEGQGQYRYPDGSVYTGSWSAGLKHGYGVYWDTSKGCLRGSWSKGVLKGDAVYDQPALHFEGEFVQGVPAGRCQFTVTSHRTLDMPKFAASHIMDSGPTLRGPAQYAIPPGSGDEPKLDEEGNPVVDEEKPALPSFPKYEGLGFTSTDLPISMTDVAFPPTEGLYAGAVPVPGVPSFNVDKGLQPAAAEVVASS